MAGQGVVHAEGGGSPASGCRQTTSPAADLHPVWWKNDCAIGSAPYGLRALLCATYVQLQNTYGICHLSGPLTSGTELKCGHGGHLCELLWQSQKRVVKGSRGCL